MPFRFELRLKSDFKAFNPDALLNSTSSNSCDTPSPSLQDQEIDSPVPVGDTLPLEVILNTNGEWEVSGSTPETSSNASGFSAARNGFRPGELFVVKIYVKMDYFEVYLNNFCLSLSEHMIPVSCIQSIIIEGDCRISKMYFGETVAVEKSAKQAMLRPLPPRAPSLKNLNQLNLEEASIIECTRLEPAIDMSEVTIDLNLNEPLFPVDDEQPPIVRDLKEQSSSNQDLSKLNSPLFTSRSLSSLRRAGSYQLVFDVSDEEDEVADHSPISPSKRAASCCILNSPPATVIKRPSLIVPPKPVPQRHLNLQNLLPHIDESGKMKRPIRTPTSETNSGPTKPLMTRTGYAIKVTHPAVQMGGFERPPETSIPRPSGAVLTVPPPVSPSISRPTKDFMKNSPASPRLPSAIPVHMKQATNRSAIRRRSIPLSIR